MNTPFLCSSGCLFAGGTRVVLELGEYRESVDVEFLCADRDGYRANRNTVSRRTLGELFQGRYRLLRDVRADRYGVRTFLDVDEMPLKLEIVSEGRVDIFATDLPGWPVPVLDRVSCVVEKLLANADRGADASTCQRDLIDLAFMLERWIEVDLDAAFDRAESAYGNSIHRALVASLDRFSDEADRARCLETLDVRYHDRLDKGLSVLEQYGQQ